jgi:hypothetical protein
MKTIYFIAYSATNQALLCKDGKFCHGIASGMGKKNTVEYKQLKACKKKVSILISRSNGKLDPVILASYPGSKGWTYMPTRSPLIRD